LFELRKIGTDGREASATGARQPTKTTFGAAVIQDVGHAVGRFVEVHRHGDSAGAGGWRSPRYAIRGGWRKRDLRGRRAFTPSSTRAGRQASDATEKFPGEGMALPTTVPTDHLRAGGFGRLSMAFKKREGKRCRSSWSKVTLLYPIGRRNAAPGIRSTLPRCGSLVTGSGAGAAEVC